MGKEKVSPQKYKKFIDGLSLLDIHIVSVDAKVAEKFSPPAKIDIKKKKKYEALEKGKFRVTYEYKLQGIKEGEKKAGLEMKVVYHIIYKSEIPITDEIFEIFSQISLPMHTWPYFRQFVHETTTQMGLPPLILDLLKINMTDEK